MITWVNVVLGVITVTLSSVIAREFFVRAKRSGQNRDKRFSGALAWQLVGEAVMGVGTLAFALAAHTGMLDHWSDMVQGAIRFGMFFATSATTIHLSRTIIRIQDGK